MSGSDLRAIIQRARVSPPRCVAGAAPRLEAEPEGREGESFHTTFWLACPCGSRQTAVLCHPTTARGESVILSPLALECCACRKVTEVFDSDLHGYDPEVCGEPRGMRGSGERQRFRCGGCGGSAGEAVATFSFNDPEGLGTLPDELAGREQDAFDWFTLEWKCAGCGEIEHVSDYERA